MRETMIKIRPFDFLDILSYEGIQKVNEHGTVKIAGHIRSQSEDEYVQMLAQDVWVDVIAVEDSGNENVIFSGIVTEALIKEENHVKILSIEIKTGTYLMDHRPHVRTYQNAGVSYDSVLESFLNTYPDSGVIATAGEGKSLGTFICQYQESDWAFARRLASRIETVLVANCTVPGIKFYFGLPQRPEQTELETNEYEVVKTNGIMGYKLKSREIYKLGDSVVFRGRQMKVAEISSRMIGNELYHTYGLYSEGDIKQEICYNQKVTGASLEASVISVSRDTVQVSVKGDENSGACGACSFPYSTVYSSPDGTGWYCMPEPGDSVRLYFPDREEGNAYVVSSTDVKSSDGAARSNPDYKSIKNKQGKEILLTPGAVMMTNNAGTSIELSDAEGIQIISDLPILIKSEQAIDISSVTSKVEVFAPEAIVMEQGDTHMALADDMMMQGAKVRLN